MHWLANPEGKSGRSKTFSDAAIQYCLTVIQFAFALDLGRGAVAAEHGWLPWSSQNAPLWCRNFYQTAVISGSLPLERLTQRHFCVFETIVFKRCAKFSSEVICLMVL